MKRSPERTQFLEDLLVTFVEDYGSNSWRQIVTWDYDAGEAVICDVEEDGAEHTVTLDVLARGCRLVMEGEIVNQNMTANATLAWHECDAGVLDSYDVDAIAQAGLWDKPIYG